MEYSELHAGENDEGRRFDRIIRKLLPRSKPSDLYAAMRKGLIKINGRKASADTRIRAGDSILIASFLIRQKTEEPLRLHDTLPNIFVNPYIRIINKPYDMPVQGGGSILSVADIIVRTADSGKLSSLSFKPAPLHRLDRRTTGLLACSQNLAGAQWFCKALAEGLIGKEYIALVEGIVREPLSWRQNLDTQKRSGSMFRTVQAVPGRKGKTALTAMHPIASGHYGGRPVSLVKFVISTGRKHQIRAQSSAGGYPLLGDTAYGAEKITGRQQLFLHAWRMTFPQDNPVLIPRIVQAPMPASFVNMLKKCLPEIYTAFIL